jgi:hypothetical protein
MLLLCLASAVALVGVIPAYWPAEVAQAADAASTQATATDRISFYNVPSDHKLEVQINYANGKAEKIKYPAPCVRRGRRSRAISICMR